MLAVVLLAIIIGLLISYLLNALGKAEERKRWRVVPLKKKASGGVGDTCICGQFVPVTPRFGDCQNLWYHENVPQLHLCRNCVYHICGVKIEETVRVVDSVDTAKK
jgi:hypothetical protein